MKFFRSKKLDVAEQVLAYLGRMDAAYGLWLEPYVNGREIGYSLSNMTHKVSFSENRNSDDIVVYCGRQRDFSMQGNVPNEAIYVVAVYHQDPEHIAKVIFDHFAKHQDERFLITGDDATEMKFSLKPQ